MHIVCIWGLGYGFENESGIGTGSIKIFSLLGNFRIILSFIETFYSISWYSLRRLNFFP